jgi:quercetin dioxygenase-like cupin family protein
MVRALLTLAVGAILGMGGLALARQDGKGAPTRKVVSARDIAEKLDGKEAKVTCIEVTLAPGQTSNPHRHPGPVFGRGRVRARH